MEERIITLQARQAVKAGQATNQTRVHPHNLPAQLTPLVGREQDVQAACTLLRRPEVRLLTFTGVGGVGKTRLALQVATELVEEFVDGVCFVSLASVTDSGLVIPIIARALGPGEAGDPPLFEHLESLLRDWQLLLVLDNFEQVLAVAPLLTDLLVACPGLKILVTSRTLLCLYGEYEFPVLPLAVPNLKHLPCDRAELQYPAVVLFQQCVSMMKPNFQMTAANAHSIAEICARLDGLPLAIELAAARIKLLSPQALLDRLDRRLELLTGGMRNLPARQQTLRNAITWSYNLLDAQEQQLFRRLSVFVGGFTLEAVESICTVFDGRDGTRQVLDGVTSLINKSLLQQMEQEEAQESRLVMLETLREYGLECLVMCGEMESVLRAHAAYYLALAEEAEQRLEGTQYAKELKRLEHEHDNLRAAMRWLLEQGEIASSREMASRLGRVLRRFWMASDDLNEQQASPAPVSLESDKITAPAPINKEAVQGEHLLLTSLASPSTSPAIHSPAYPAGLTEREVEVLRLVAQGLTNPRIAEQLIISLYTVNAHLRSIFNKLDVNSRNGVTRFAIEHELI